MNEETAEISPPQRIENERIIEFFQNETLQQPTLYLMFFAYIYSSVQTWNKRLKIYIIASKHDHSL